MENLKQKIEGCLTGAIMGTELGSVHAPRFGGLGSGPQIRAALDEKIDLDNVIIQPKSAVWSSSLAPLIQLMASAYLKKQGRIVPEDFGAALAADESLAKTETFWFLDLYSAIERLREGVPARINGIGACPDGNMCAAMAIVGIYHAKDPECAYMDGDEISSVVQRSPATVWAALTAAAVAEALNEGCTAAKVVKTVTDMAFKYCKDVYYEIMKLIKDMQRFDDDGFYEYCALTNCDSFREYRGHNPVANAMLLLSRFGDSPEKMLRLANMKSSPEIHASVMGAIVGALYGRDKLGLAPTKRIEALISPVLPLVDVALDKLKEEKRIIVELEKISKISSEICPDGQNLLYSKVLGCILAGAIGNAMGSPVEGRQYPDIDRQYPDGVKTVLEPWRLEAEDDNQVAMMLYEAYISREGLPAGARDYGEQWKRSMDKDMFFYCLRNTYDLLNSGMDPRICGQWNLVTGSSVMCLEPAGVYHAADPKNAYIDATALSYLNQRGLDVTAAAILAAATAEAMRKDATAESVVGAALDAAPKTKMVTFDRRKIDTPYDYISRCAEIAGKYDDVFAVRGELYEQCLYYHCIDPLELLGFSFAMLLISKGDVRTAAIGGTNIGRDSDTIAGRAAMLAGTISGYQNIPAEWVDMVNKNSLKKIQANARKIADLIENKKLVLMKNRQT